MVGLSHSLNCMFLWMCFVSSACFPTHFWYLNVLQLFFFKSQVIATNKFNIGRCDDFVWVTKDELLEYFPEHADYLNKMIISWCTRFHNFVMWVRFPLSAFTFLWPRKLGVQSWEFDIFLWFASFGNHIVASPWLLWRNFQRWVVLVDYRSIISRKVA